MIIVGGIIITLFSLGLGFVLGFVEGANFKEQECQNTKR